MSYLERLKNAKSIHDFAPMLGFQPKTLAYLLYKLPDGKKYTTFSIPKKSGGERQIHAPEPRLKLVQRRLANFLNECVQETEQLYRRQPLFHGFKKKIKLDNVGTPEYISLGIHTNAKYHKNKRYVLNLDLENFFPSFNFGRVRGFFIKDNHYMLSPSIATLIAQIACHHNELPQGSPCSPIITNLIAHILDIRLTRLAKQYKCTYSRYADDITFSTNQKLFPQALACPTNKSCEWHVSHKLEALINRSGFKVNHRKTRLQYCQSRQTVTGLVVNKRVNVRSEYYHYARSMCHSLFTKGEFFLPGESQPANIQQLEGILSHIHFIKKFSSTEAERSRIKKEIETSKREHGRPKLDGVSELYSKFLFYRYFVQLESTLILCEGKTDSIYLKCAIRQLSKKEIYNIPVEVNFFQYTPRVTDVMRIHEGSAALKNFIEYFVPSTSKFKNQTRNHPIIVLLDNDQEAEGVIRLLSNKFPQNGVTYDRKKNFIYYVIHNLYVMLLPMSADVMNNKIEDFFNASVISATLNGKTFSARNGKNFDHTKHYSKYVFATRVVHPQQDAIDFTQFKAILEMISQVSHDYSHRI